MSIVDETSGVHGELVRVPLPDGGTRFEAQCPSWKRGIAGDPGHFVIASCSLLVFGAILLSVFLPGWELLGAIVLVVVSGAFCALSAIALLQIRRGSFTAEMRDGHLVYTDLRPYAPGAGRTIDTEKNEVVKWRRSRNGITLHFGEAVVWGYELRRKVRIARFLSPDELDEFEAALREHLNDAGV